MPVEIHILETELFELENNYDLKKSTTDHGNRDKEVSKGGIVHLGDSKEQLFIFHVRYNLFLWIPRKIDNSLRIEMK